MPIQYASPERRNLTVLSMSIIVYYAAGGRVIKEIVSLPMVNVEFENKAVLAAFFWGILIWFLLRYWMVARLRWLSDYHQDLKEGVPKYLRNKYIPGAYIREKILIQTTPK